MDLSEFSHSAPDFGESGIRFLNVAQNCPMVQLNDSKAELNRSALFSLAVMSICGRKYQVPYSSLGKRDLVR
ncbi:hypothetical protein SUGI_0030670 [Cryptomeria japonica]|nr:hypothetical protein SUGI_0030670 [Cryptomeria japonica]